MSKIYNRLFGKSNKKCQEEAELIYQIKEFNSEIWLTYNGALVCPISMFTREPIEALELIRSYYVVRNSTEEDIKE